MLLTTRDCLKQAFESVPIGMGLISLNGGWLEVNPALCQMTGYSEEELKTFTDQEITHPDDLEMESHYLQQLLNGEIMSYQIEKRFFKKSGDCIWIHFIGSVVSNKQGAPLFILAQVKEITKRKRNEQEHRNHELEYRSLFESSQDPIIIYREGKVVFSNQQAHKAFGCSCGDENIRQSLLKYIHPEDHEKVSSFIEKMKVTKESFAITDLRIFTRQQEWLTVEVLTTPILYRRKVSYLIIFRNVTKRKHLEDELRKSNECFRHIFESSPVGIALRDKQKRAIDINSAFLNMLGYEKDEVMGRCFTEFVHPDDLDVEDDLHRELIAGIRDSYEIEKRYMNKNGAFFWAKVRVSHYPIRDDEEELLIGIVEDITKRKEMEEALKKREMKFRRVFENAGIGIGIRKKSGEIIDANPAFEKMTGYTKEELTNIPISAISEPALLEENLYNDLIAGKRKFYQIEKRYFRKDGQEVWGNLIVSLFPSEGNKDEIIIGMVEDITERKSLEHKLIQSEERFRSLVNSMNDIVFTIDENQCYTGIYGLNKQECLLGKTVSEVFGKDEALIHQKYIQLALNGRHVTYEWSEFTDEGTQNYQTSLSPLRNSTNETEGVVGVVRNITSMKETESKLIKMNKKLQQLSSLDGLTAIPNRRYFDQRIKQESKRAKRSLEPLSLVMFDLDFFKLYNDTYGHQAGDDCLKLVASTIQQLCRSGDIIARYGGEEFAAILPETDLEGAKVMAERFRAAIEKLNIPHDNSKIGNHVTISVGVAYMEPEYPVEPKTLIERADHALYSAKNDGRNRVRTFDNK